MGALNKLNILVPESRELDLFAGMLEAHGAKAVRCPLVQIVDLEDDIESCGGTRAGRHALEGEEEEEDKDVPSLVRRNRRSKASNDVPIQALSGWLASKG